MIPALSDVAAANVDVSSTSMMGFVLTASIMGSSIAVLVWVLQKVMGDRAMARWFYLLWLVVLLRFLLFAVPESPTSVLNLIRTKPNASVLSVDANDIDRRERQIIFAPPALSPLNTKSSTSDSVWPRNLSVSGTLLAIWLAGICVVLMRLIASCFEAHQLVRRSLPPGEVLSNVFAEIQKQHGFSRMVSIRVSKTLESPAMVGLFRPVVLVPSWCKKELTKQQLRFVLIHELVHIRRRDNWIQLLACLTQAVHWFNPLVWLVKQSIESSRELACDQTVISICSSGQTRTETSRDYGATILQIATRKKRSTSVPALVGPFINANNQLIQQRIAMLVSSNQKSVTCKLVLTIFLLVVVAVGFTSAQTPDRKPIIANDGLLALSDGQSAKDSEVLKVNEIYAEPVYTLRSSPSAKNRMIKIAIDQSRMLEFDYPIPEIRLMQEGIVDVEPLSPDQLRIKSLQTGKVELQVIGVDGKKETIDVSVLPFDAAVLQNELDTEFPGEGVRVQVEPKQIILWGGCSKANADQIVRWFTNRTKLDVVNQILVDPIAVEINVYEISKSKLKEMGIMRAPENVDVVNSVGTLLGSKQIDRFSHVEFKKGDAINLLEKLRQHGVAKNTDNPVIVMAPGRPGEFLRGGEVPFAKVDEDGKPQVEFRSFGIKVQMEPIGDYSDGGAILNLKAELTDLGAPGPDGVPQFNTRRINMAASLNPGKSICFFGDYQPHNREGEDCEIVIVVSPRKIQLAKDAEE